MERLYEHMLSSALLFSFFNIIFRYVTILSLTLIVFIFNVFLNIKSPLIYEQLFVGIKPKTKAAALSLINVYLFSVSSLCYSKVDASNTFWRLGIPFSSRDLALCCFYECLSTVNQYLSSFTGVQSLTARFILIYIPTARFILIYIRIDKTLSFGLQS